MKQVEVSFVPDTRSDGQSNKENQIKKLLLWHQPRKTAHNDWSKRRSTVNSCELWTALFEKRSVMIRIIFFICDTKYIVVNQAWGVQAVKTGSVASCREFCLQLAMAWVPVIESVVMFSGHLLFWDIWLIALSGLCPTYVHVRSRCEDLWWKQDCDGAKDRVHTHSVSH